MTAGEVLAEFSWEHDLLGNVKKQFETWPGEAARLPGIRTTAMGYDDANRLTSEVVTQPEASGATPTTTTLYTYDAANNRATKTVTRTIAGEEPISDEDTGFWSYTYNSANQLTAWQKRSAAGEAVQKSATVAYDAAGNRSSQTVTQAQAPSVGSATQPPAARPGTTSYTWDAQDRLLGVTLPDGSHHDYEYDYRTRRIGTTSTTAGTTPATKQTAIVFSGGLSVAEWEAENSAPGMANAPTVEYTRGPDMGGGVGGLLYSLRSEAGLTTATAKYNLSNGRGDIVAQSSQSAALTWTASYEAYGKRTKETGENQDKQRGNSKDEDPTGLLNEGFRYRDLEAGVWLSRDPAGFVDGPNVYAYVRQNPWTGFDPKGLATKEIGHVYVEMNHKTKEYYVGETERPPTERMNDINHQASKLREKEGTIGYSRTIVADDNPTEASAKAQRMVVEREIQDAMAKNHPDYQPLGKQRLSDEKYQMAKETTNPRLKPGEAPTEYESQKKSFFSSTRSMKSVGTASGRIPLALKVGGVGGLVGIASMFANGEAAAAEMNEHAEGWKQATADGDNDSARAYEALMTQGFTQQNGGPTAAAVMLEFAEARKEAQKPQ